MKINKIKKNEYKIKNAMFYFNLMFNTKNIKFEVFHLILYLKSK